MLPLRSWQAEGITAIHDALAEVPRVLAAAPTGTGKGVIAAWLQRTFGARCAIVSPRCEILAGIAQKKGADVWRPADLQALDLWTPVRLRNRLRDGNAPDYGALILDEGHHATADSWQEVVLAHFGCPIVGLTATPFRGTPRETLKLREMWGETVVLRSWREAAVEGDLAVPLCEVVPLLDDDIVTVSGAGDFQVSSAESELGGDRLEAVCILARAIWRNDPRPALLSVPSRELVREALAHLESLGVPAVGVTERTPPEERQAAFRAAVAREALLVQIAIVSEGVDLPELRIWIDALPTLSPVRWTQTLGRITRPGAPGRYVCTNRNLERFAYLLEGLIPSAKVAEAQQAFGGASKRLGARHLGLEALGRFKAIRISLADGVETHGFALRAWDAKTQKQQQYFAVAVPVTGEVLFAERENVRRDEKWSYGKWKEVPIPADLAGYTSSPKAWNPSEKQLEWWRRSAQAHGLAPDPPKEARAWQVLPVLAALRRRI